jgi:dUTP pyrophosphatase
MIEIKVKKLTNTAIIPQRETSGSAGVDLHADIDKIITIRPHETVKIPTGIAMELPEGMYGAIVARSGLSTKEGLRPANCYGVCDTDYRGEYIVSLHNDSNETRLVRPGQRIAQLLIKEYVVANFVEVEELSKTERGFGGFGSTGI